MDNATHPRGIDDRNRQTMQEHALDEQLFISAYGFYGDDSHLAGDCHRILYCVAHQARAALEGKLKNRPKSHLSMRSWGNGANTTWRYIFGAVIFTSQLTPNLSINMPNESPQGALSRGMVTVPPAESF